ELLSGLVGARGVLPEDSGTSLWGDDRVAAELEDEHAIRDPEGERAARAAFADDRCDNGHSDARHRSEGRSDRFALPPLLGADSWIGARRVDERQNREIELVRELVEADRLSIPFGVRHPEVALHVLFGTAPFHVAHDDDAAVVVAREPTHDRGIVRKA